MDIDFDPLCIEEEKYEATEQDLQSTVKTEFVELIENEVEKPEIKFENDEENEDPLAVEPGSSSISATGSLIEPRLCYVLLDRINVNDYICPDSPDSFVSAEYEDDVDDFDYFPLDEEEQEYEVETRGAPPHNPDGTRIWEVPFKSEEAESEEMSETEETETSKQKTKKKTKKFKIPRPVYECDFCPKTYKNQQTLLKHEQIHPELEKLICKFCSKRFISIYFLNLHYRKDHRDDILKSKVNKPPKIKNTETKCNICNKQFASPDCLKQHAYVHKSERRFKCDVCDMAFKRSSHLKTHIKALHLRYRIPCPNCNKLFNNKKVLKVHLKNNKCSLSKLENLLVLKCDNCYRLFKELKTYNIHMNYLKQKGDCKKFIKTKFKCECNEKFTGKSQLNKHWLTVHKINGSGLTCISCNKTFVTFEYLKLHLTSVHFTETTYPCDYCHTVFNSEKILHNHYKYYHDLIPSYKNFFKCDFCNAKIPSKSTLLCHIRVTHLHKKNYSCGSCGKWFMKISTLNNHKQRKHVSKKNIFKCNICEKIFNTKDELTLHEYEKHGIRIDPCKLKCTICFKKFQIQSYLDLHVLLMHAKITDTDEVNVNTEA